MLTKSYPTLRRLSACMSMLILLCVSSTRGAQAQAAPLATASTSTPLTPPSGLGTVYQTAVDTYGDLLVVDYANGALYEYPVGSTTAITLVAAGGLGGFDNPGIALDANNTMYLEGNYNNCLLRIPFDIPTKTWPELAGFTPANSSSSCSAPTLFMQYGTLDTSPYYFQPWALAVDKSGNVIVSNQNSGNFIFSVTPSTTTSAPATATAVNNLLLTTMSARVQSMAVDPLGNVFFVEETDQKAPLPGVVELPAGSKNVASDAGLVRVDPMLPSVSGVATDSAGNLYISDSKLGVFFVPNTTGTPNTAAAVLLTPLPANGQVSFDSARGILYVPTSVNGAEVISEVTFNSAELGSTATGAAAATSTPVLFGFSGSATPASFVVEEAGSKAPDFSIATGGTCLGGTTYPAQSSCTVNVALSPNSAGAVSAKLLALDGSGNILASIVLHGTGVASAAQILPGTEGAVGKGLMTPKQLAVDAAGNTYVADSGLSLVEMFPKGAAAATAGTPVGTGLTTPTGVAVNGAGDVFIGDSGTGSVVEVPNGPSGLNAAGQATIRTGLGTNLNLAVDGSGNIYIADPLNHRVVRISSAGGTLSLLAQTEKDFGGFNAPSAVAVDSNLNIFVADGANLYEIAPSGAQTTVLTTLTNATGLAVDASGSVYVTEGSQTLRIPNVGGTLTAASATTIATDDTTPASIAVDGLGNLYITNMTAGDVETVSANVAYNFGTLTSQTGSASQTFMVQNFGNAPLVYTAFTGTADFSETATTCTSPIAVDANCSLTVTFSPGPGDQGSLAGEVVLSGNEANAPVGVSGVGVGAALVVSTTKVSVTNPTVDAASAVVTVSGSAATPTGTVTLTVTGKTLTTPLTVTGTLSGGTVTLTPPQLAAGAYTYTVAYAGDRAYSPSTATTSVTVGPGAVTIVQATVAQFQALDSFYPYILGGGNGTAEPFDGSVLQFQYNYAIQVVATDGQPLIGQPVYDSQGKLVGENYGSVSFTGAGSCTPVNVNADGTAPFSTSCLGVSTTNTSIPDILQAYTFTPVYSPAGSGSTIAGSTNPNYSGATGTAFSMTALRNPMVTLTSNPAALSVTAGSKATATITMTSILGFGVDGSGGLLNNYSLPVQLACDGLPAYATCSFSYPNPDPSEADSVHVGPATGTVLSFAGAAAAPCTVAQGCSGPGTVIMTINTNVGTGVAALDRTSSGAELAAMLGLGVLGMAFGRKRTLRTRLLTLLCVVLLSGTMVGMTGCSTKQLGANSNSTASPAGTYTVLVTAKQVGSQVITSNNGPQTVYGNGNQMSLPFSITVTVK
jgi:sugar lactone lactonase YvrE